QEAWRGEPAQLASVPGDITPQPDDILGRPVGEQMTEATLFLRHVQHELRVAWHALELAEMADQLRVLHQSFDMLAPHQHDLLRIEAEEGLLEGRPLGIDQTMLETGAKDSPADQREIAVVDNRSHLIGAGRLRQQRLQGRRRAEAVQAVFVQPFVVTHASLSDPKNSSGIACRRAGRLASPPIKIQPRKRCAASLSSWAVALQPRQPSVIDTP